MKTTRKKPKILVYVDGGVVQSVYADTAVDVAIYDRDELKDGHGIHPTPRYALLDKAIKGMKEQLQDWSWTERDLSKAKEESEKLYERDAASHERN